MRYGWVLIGAAALLAGCASAEGFVRPGFNFAALKSVAVVEVTGARGSSARQGQIGDLFELELMMRGYPLVERGRIAKVIEEHKFQASTFASPDGAARAGQIMNADAIMIVNVPELGDEISISARMVQVETGAVLFAASGSGSTRHGAATVAGALIGAAAGAATGHAVSGREHRGTGTTVGAIAGGVAGGLVGYALEPRQANVAAKVVRKICENLPSLLVPAR
jgi:hypothetical protein